MRLVFFIRQDMEQEGNRMWKEECVENWGGGRMGWRQADHMLTHLATPHQGCTSCGEKTHRQWKRCPQDGMMYHPILWASSS